MTDAAVQVFNKISKQRIDYAKLPGGGERATMTITLPPMPGYPNGRTLRYTEDITATDLTQYAEKIAGIEIGAIMRINGIGAITPEIGNIFGDIAKGIGNGLKAVAGVAKKIVTSKVMQTAAKGLAMVAPALGPMAAPAMAVSGGIGIAGKLLASKTAKAVGAPNAASALASSAAGDAKKLGPMLKLNPALMLNLAANKAQGAFKLASNAASTPAPKPRANDVLAAARSGRVRSNFGGTVTPAALQAAHAAGRVFFVAA